MSKNVLIKAQKPQLCYCPDGLLVKLSTFHTERPASNPTWANFLFFPKLFKRADTLSRKKLSGNPSITWSPTMLAGSLHSSWSKLGKGHHVNVHAATLR